MAAATTSGASTRPPGTGALRGASSTSGAARTGLAVWVGVVGLGLAWGALVRGDEAQGLLAAPFVGRWRLGPDERMVRLVPVALIGAVVVAVGPRVAERLRWRLVPPVTGAASAAAAVMLAASDGWAAVPRPLGTRHEYLALVPRVRDPGAFVSTFLVRAADYPIHVKGHPPGATLAFWALDRAGMGGPTWAAAVVIAAGGVAVATALITTRAVSGEATARAAAPFLVLAPAALWVATTADALFSGIIAVGITLVVQAVCRRAGVAGDALALAGGVVLALALHVSYGAVPLLLVPLAVAVARRRLRPLVVASVGASLVTAAFTVAGFWWFDGLTLTSGLYREGIAAHRPWPYHVLVGNPSLLAISVGPATVAGVAVLVSRHRGRRSADGWARSPALLPLAALAAVVLANASTLSKAEVERIWIPFAPWLLLAAAAVATDGRSARRWLWPQVAITIVLQATLESPW